MGAARCKKGSGFPRKCVCLQRALNSNLNRSCCCCSCCGYLWSCMSTGQTDRKTGSRTARQRVSQVFILWHSHPLSKLCTVGFAWSVSDMFKLLRRAWRGGGVLNLTTSFVYCCCVSAVGTVLSRRCAHSHRETKFPKLSEHICIDNFGDAM